MKSRPIRAATGVAEIADESGRSFASMKGRPLRAATL
jgi:hypothetical protein